MKWIQKLICTFLFLALTASTLYSKSEYFYYQTQKINTGFNLLGFSVKPSYNSIPFLFWGVDLPDGFTVYKSVRDQNNNFTWSIYTYDLLLGGWTIDQNDTNAVVSHGESVFIYNPSTQFDLVVVGEIVSFSTASIKSGFNLMSSKSLKVGGISSVHGLSPNNGDIIYKFVNGNWSVHTFEDGEEPSWQPTEPSISPNDGFYYQTITPFNWNQFDYAPNAYNTTTNRNLYAFYYKDVSTPSAQNQIWFGGTLKANIEGLINFAASSTLTNANWFDVSTYGPAVQPVDMDFMAVWPIYSNNKNGYLRVSTY